MQQGDGNDFLPPDPAALGATTSDGGNEPARGSASATVTAHTERLMALPGVVVVGETRDATGQPAVLVGVKTSRALAKVPTQIDGVPVVTQVVGEIDAQ